MQRIASNCILDVFVWLFYECTALRKTSIQKQHRYVDILQFVSDSFFVVLDETRFSKVKKYGSCFDFVLRLEHGQFFVNFAFWTTDNANIETKLRHLLADLKTNTVRSTRDNNPGV